MVYVRADLYVDGVFHIYNRGVAKQPLFHDPQDCQHFLDTLSFYREATPERRFSKTDRDERRKLFAGPVKQPLVDIVAYCLMPNHFHLILVERVGSGISTFMRRAMNSYTRAYNTRYRRVGTIFQGTFCAVEVTSDEQLLHLSRYLHLNPFVARLVETPAAYEWSSYPAYLGGYASRIIQPELILGLAHTPAAYQEFVEDYMSYARELSRIKDLLLDIND